MVAATELGPSGYDLVMNHSYRLVVLFSALTLAMLLAAPSYASDTAMQDSLRAAEIAFAQTAADRDIDAFRSFLAEGVVFAGGGGPLRGADAIVEGWATFFAADGPSIEWQPESVEVTDGGLLGMTRGRYAIRFTAADGSPGESKGTFFSVWKRASVEDPWRIVLDNGAPDPPCSSP